jgi:hypothetical protein
VCQGTPDLCGSEEPCANLSWHWARRPAEFPGRGTSYLGRFQTVSYDKGGVWESGRCSGGFHRGATGGSGRLLGHMHYAGEGEDVAAVGQS